MFHPRNKFPQYSIESEGHKISHKGITVIDVIVESMLSEVNTIAHSCFEALSNPPSVCISWGYKSTDG